jgi:hypothetical protein
MPETINLGLAIGRDKQAMNADESLKNEMATPLHHGNSVAPYFLGLGRATVSLGPVSSKSYCPYRCRFCYVQGPFPKYAAAKPPEIVAWLHQRRTAFDIVYVSGDTDSFARPRTDEGLDLLENLLDLGVDVSFTTRAVFAPSQEKRLSQIARRYRARKLLLVACISISQLNHSELEPQPIADPTIRAAFLKRLHNADVTTVLAIRPFIPSVPAAEYGAIATLACTDADVVLGSDLFLDPGGTIRTGIESATSGSVINGSSIWEELDFSLGGNDWEVVSYPEAIAEVSEICEASGTPFFMRSKDAVAWLRERRNSLRTTLTSDRGHRG